MPHYSPQLVERWTCVSSLLLSHTPHRRSTGGSRGATQRGVRFDLGGVSQLTFWRQGWILDPFIIIFYFVRLPLCNKYSDYCDIYLYTLCYYICCLLWRMYEMHLALFFKARVWQLVVDPKKVADILNWKAPEDVHGIKSFIGMDGYYRRFTKREVDYNACLSLAWCAQALLGVLRRLLH